MQTHSSGKPQAPCTCSSEEVQWLIQEEKRHDAMPVSHGEYDRDTEEILSQIRNLLERVNALEKKTESQT